VPCVRPACPPGVSAGPRSLRKWPSHLGIGAGPPVATAVGMLIQLPVISMVLAASATAGAGVDPPAATASASPPADEVVRGRDAQVKLADTLAEAASIQDVVPRHHTITFAIVDQGEAIDLIATTHNGEVVELATHDRGPALGWDGSEDGTEQGGLSWLADVMQETTAVTRLVVDRDGAVTLITSDGQRYMAIPGRGSGGGNTAVEARWADAWNH
jgi:hypothetical protein